MHKTAKQWIEESNWSDELKELFWERASDLEEDDDDIVYLDITDLMNHAFTWSATPEGFDFWLEVAGGKRTDIDRPVDALAGVSAGDIVAMPHREDIGERVRTDREYETLVRRLLLSLKGRELDYDDFFERGYNAGIREMNEKIDEAIKKLEL